MYTFTFNLHSDLEIDIIIPIALRKKKKNWRLEMLSDMFKACQLANRCQWTLSVKSLTSSIGCILLLLGIGRELKISLILLIHPFTYYFFQKKKKIYWVPSKYQGFPGGSAGKKFTCNEGDGEYHSPLVIFSLSSKSRPFYLGYSDVRTALNELQR